MEITLDESIKFLTKQHPNFPKCEIKDYIRLKKKLLNTYQPVDSNKQIRTIMKLSREYKLKDYSDRLIILVSRHTNMRGVYKFLNSRKLSDSEVYNELQKYVKKRHKKELSRYSKGPDEPCDGYMRMVQRLNYIIQQNIDPKFKIQNYLDIGCGDCIKTKLLGDLLGLKSKQVYGADIPAWSSYTQQQRKQLPINIIDLEANKVLPIKSNKFSLVSAYMVLHHVKNLKLMLDEIHRILKPGGYLIIKEHDALTSLDYMLADVEHAIYEIVYGKSNHQEFEKSHYAKYYDWLEWDLIMYKHQFKCIYSRHIYSHTSQYFQPTRGYIAIYQKK